MQTQIITAILVAIMIAQTTPIASAMNSLSPKTLTLSRKVLKDKIRGGWAGQMFGVSFDTPTEFKSLGKIFEGEIKWTPEMISNSIYAVIYRKQI